MVNWEFQIKKNSWKKYAENVQQKLVPDPFLILANTQKSQYMQVALSKIRHFERELLKKFKGNFDNLTRSGFSVISKITLPIYASQFTMS